MLTKLIRPDYYDEDYVLNEYEYKGICSLRLTIFRVQFFESR